MPTKKKSVKAKAGAKKARTGKSRATKKARAGKSRATKKAAKRSVLSSRIGKTAAGVLAGAAAGAVRALIPQLEEAAGATEKIAKSTTQHQQKPKRAAR